MKYLILSLTLVGCTPTAVNTQVQVADAISQSVNALAPTIVEEYRVELRTCRVEANGEPTKYALCAADVDSKWQHFRDVWNHMRRLQDEYATAIEKKEPRLADYAEWLQIAFCELKAVAPAGLKLPAVPGLACKDE